MATPIDVQIIHANGRPAFVVIPYDQFKRLYPETPGVPEGDGIPHAVVKRHITEAISMPRAWREHLRLTQEELAARMGITQAAVARMEMPGKKLQKATRQRLAEALGITPQQLS
jgi:hypothetical protein